MKRNILLLMAISVLLTGCTDYNYITTIILVNNSSHTISITDADFDYSSLYIEESYTLAPGTKASYGFSDMSNTYNDYETAVPMYSKVTFDEKYQIEHSYKNKEMPNSLCDGKNYELTLRKKRTEEYTFTFTDADFEYAVENNTTE